MNRYLLLIFSGFSLLGCTASQQSHNQQMTELQVQYQLTTPIYFVCDDNPAKVVVITYFDTKPASLMAEFGDSNSIMISQPSASGAHYQGPNEQFWEHQGEALITWGDNAAKMKCKMKP